MKTIEEILNNYSEYETFLDDRFGYRFCDFLTVEQAEKLGFKFNEGYNHIPLEWNEENILNQLKQDVEFGYSKCLDRRGFSSELMVNAVLSWCKVLENGLENTDYGYYGDKIFKAVDMEYGFEVTQ